MKNIFYFGEKIKEFDTRVLNEREVRASAGILFFFALLAFMNSWITGDFHYTKIFVIIFLVDFFIRIFINPKFSPSLIIGRFFVQNQKPEYVGAVQKRFAWSIGFVLALTMFYLIVLNNIIGPINLFMCLTCLILLFFETAFGICIGCKIYTVITRKKAELCPGGVCKKSPKEEIQKINFLQIGIVALFLIFTVSLFTFGMSAEPSQEKNIEGNTEKNISSKISSATGIFDSCEVPDWAIAIGHEEKWKLHHACK